MFKYGYIKPKGAKQQNITWIEKTQKSLQWVTIEIQLQFFLRMYATFYNIYFELSHFKKVQCKNHTQQLISL